MIILPYSYVLYLGRVIYYDTEKVHLLWTQDVERVLGWRYTRYGTCVTRGFFENPDSPYDTFDFFIVHLLGMACTFEFDGFVWSAV